VAVDRLITAIFFNLLNNETENIMSKQVVKEPH